MAERTALFPSRDRATAMLEARIKRMPGGATLRADPDELLLKVQAAESQAARLLGVLLRPTEVFPVEAPPADVAALPAGMPYVVEPAYDLPPDWLSGSTFGALKLNKALVSKVTSLELRHPTFEASYRVPIEWVQLDGRAGLLNVVPGGGSNFSNLPLGMFLLQAMGVGLAMPHMIRVRYTAGLTQDNEFYPEVVDLVLRGAALRFLADSFTPQSTSISADGLSQSRSLDLDKHQAALEADYESLHQRLKGPVWGVL